MNMRHVFFGFIFLIGSAVSAQDQTNALGALRWAFHWRAAALRMPPEVQCRCSRSASATLYFCSPGEIAVHYNPKRDGTGFVASVHTGMKQEDAEAALQTQWPPGAGRQAIEACGSTKWTPADLRYTPNVLFSQHLRSLAEPFLREEADAYMRHGRHTVKILFPQVSSTDPLYWVYMEVDGRPEKLNEYSIVNGRISDIPIWTYDRYHHNIPRVISERFRKDATMWLAPLMIPAHEERNH